MPNQLAQSKRRMTMAAETAVLAALEVIAKANNLTVTDLLQQSVRSMISERATNPELRETIRQAVVTHAPTMAKEFRSPAKGFLTVGEKSLRNLLQLFTCPECYVSSSATEICRRQVRQAGHA